MRYLLTLLIIMVTANLLSAQLADSLNVRQTYHLAWKTAMADGKITPEETALMTVLGNSLGLPQDSSRSWEIQWRHMAASPLDQSGRWPLVLQNMVIGSSLYGWAIPYVLQAEDFRWFVGGEMVSLGGAYYLTYTQTKNMQIPHARSQMMRYGALVGFRYGTGINELLELDGGSGEQRETAWAWVLMASVPVGHLGGEYLYKNYHPSNGQAWAWTAWTGIGGLTSRLMYRAFSTEPEYQGDFYYDYDDPGYQSYLEEKREWQRRHTLFELMGYPVGAAIGYRLIQHKSYSFGDALMLIQGWGFGFFNTMMLQNMLMDEPDFNSYFFIASLGAIGSTLAYDYWIRNDDYSFGQATLMLLGSVSGTAFGFGTGVLLDVTDREPLIALGLMGYAAGTFLTRSILDIPANGSLSSAHMPGVSLSPTLLPAHSASGKALSVPGLSMQLRF